MIAGPVQTVTVRVNGDEWIYVNRDKVFGEVARCREDIQSMRTDLRDEMTQNRRELRQQYRLVRQQITQEQPTLLQSMHATLRQWLLERRIRCLGVYWPIRGEPDLRDVAVEALRQGVIESLALPVVTDTARGLMHYVQWRPGQTMRSGSLGIAEPDDVIPVTPDAVLAPCVAFNDAGFRLGNGGGFFDRFLTAHEPSLVTVAVAYEALRCTQWEPQEHDRAFQWILTESGMRKLISSDR